MLRVTNDTEKLDEIEAVADVIFKALNGLNPHPSDAMMALCLVLSFIIESHVDPRHQLEAVADIHSAVVANIKAQDAEDEPDHGTVN